MICPDCGGSLQEVPDGPLVRYRCRVGHAWAGESLLASRGPEVEGALWMALRGLDEKADLARRLAAPAHERGHHRTGHRFDAAADEASRAADLLRALLVDPTFTSALITRAGTDAASARGGPAAPPARPDGP